MSDSEDEPTVFGWIDEINRRRGTYWADDSRGLSRLSDLVSGYGSALRRHGIVEDAPDMMHFADWLRIRRRWSLSQGWVSAIEAHSATRNPLDHAFHLVSEFRRLRPVVVRSAVLLREDVGRDFREAEDVSPIRGMEEVFLVEYRDMNVYFARIRNGTRVENHRLMWKNGEYLRTLEDVLPVVEAEFGVPRDGWKVHQSG